VVGFAVSVVVVDRWVVVDDLVTPEAFMSSFKQTDCHFVRLTEFGPMVVSIAACYGGQAPSSLGVGRARVQRIQALDGRRKALGSAQSDSGENQAGELHDGKLGGGLKKTGDFGGG